MNLKLGYLLIGIACCTVSVGRGESPAVDLNAVDAATRAMWLIDGTVVNAETREPIDAFLVTPGTTSTDDDGKTAIRWRDNLKRPMTEGRLQWPRTSGFSVMRFRITAPGYQPAVTHRIWRGGPHTRILVKLVPLKEPAGTQK